MRRAEVEALTAPLANAAPATPRGILAPGSTRHSTRPLRPKRVTRHIGTPATPEVTTAIDTIRTELKRRVPGIMPSFTTNSGIIRSALLAYARDLTN